MTQRAIGRRMPRLDAVLQVTGRSVYGADVSRPNMLFAKILRSAHAHARIVKIDTSEAEALEGVKAVITAKDVPHNRWGFTHQDQPVLADDKVRFFGDGLAAVAATSVEAAEEALRLVRVDYEPLPAVFDPREALRPEAPRVHGDTNLAAHLKIRSGDIERGWRESDVVIEEGISTQRVEHAHLEPHAALAEVSPAGDLVVHSSLGRPFLVASDLGKVLKMPMSRIRVVTTAVGGGFGGKNEMSMEPHIALLAMKTGRPVKMVYTRRDEFEVSTIRHPYLTRYKSGLKKDGTLVARQVDIVSDSGAYVSWGESTLSKAAIHAAGPYRIPHVAVDGYLVYTNNPVGGAMRGFGATQLGFAYEVHTDTIAAELGLDPVAFRLKNLLTDGGVLPTGQTLETVTAKECLTRALALAGWERGGR